jgi:hypothetical protein
MIRFGRVAAIVSAMVATCSVVPNIAASGAAGNAAADGGARSAPAAVDRSQTPLAVRDHSARLTGKTNASQHLRLALGIRTRDTAGAERFNQQVQDKSSPLFHKYLTADQWNSRFGPTAADEQAVVDWAKANGLTVSRRYSNRLLVDVDAPVSAIAAALHVNINNYSLKGETFFSNDVDPSLPSSIRSIVTSVDGINNLNHLAPTNTVQSAPKEIYSAGAAVQARPVVRSNAKAAKPAGPGANAAPGNYDPTDIYSSQAYDEDALHKQSNCCNPFHVGGGSPASSSIAIATAGSHSFAGDMAGWNSAFPYIAYNINEFYIDGTPSSLDYEGTMDTEWSTSLANSFGSYLDTAHVYVYSGVNANFSTFDDIYNSILTNNTAKVVSSSWGCAEFYCTPDGTMNTDHAIFNSMIAQGFTLVNSSGDRGGYADCNSAHKSVSFPASDSNFLAIGATNLELAAGPVFQSQTAWGDVGNCAGNGGGTGGGCSAKYAAPSWQSSITSGFCGTAAKALPDVSLNGDWFNSPQSVFFNGAWSGNGGTSISAPMMGGFYAQQNSYGIELGSICGGGGSPCAPLGQGGQQLYLAAAGAAQGKKALYDVTSGCTTNEVGSGFCAITGYDRATGWGTPNMLQFAWANNYWNMPEASPPTVNISGPATNTWLNSGTLSWSTFDNGSPASGISGWTSQWDSDPGDPASHATPGTGDSFYSGPASAHGSTSGSAALSSAGEGCHTLFVRSWDNIGESAVNSYGPVCYDGTAPVFTANPTPAFKVGSKPNTSGLPVKISWAATDNLSGIASYQLWQSTDGAAFVEIVSGSTTPNASVRLQSGHSYQFAVGAFDNAGNFGGFDFTNVFKATLAQENGVGVSYSAGWSRVALAGSSGGSVDKATLANKTATFQFKGTTVTWIATLGSAYGDATVSIDGGPPKTVHTHAASTTTKDLVYAKSGLAAGPHTLKITVSGTAGHPRIDVDAFAFLH